VTSSRLMVIGLGPGPAEWLTPEASQALAAAKDLFGYAPYLARLPQRDGQRRHASDNREELARAREALRLAASGGEVAVVSGGDPGVFAMAAAVFEAIETGEPHWREIDVTVIPGISAMLAAAARIGAPLGHDFCAISLSDLLTPWPVIERRLSAAAAADFVVALYNPASGRRRTQIVAARDILLAHRSPETPVALARNLGRPGESVSITTLGALDVAAIDMLTLVLVGSSATRLLAGSEPLLYTPRGYAAKRGARP